jgi:predicted RNA-binding Zn ribbon-like protein
LPTVHLLRQHVRGITEAVAAGRAPLEADLAALDAALGAPQGHLALVGPDTPRAQLAFATQASDVDLFTLRVALSLATFLGSSQRHRLKLCANPDCGFAFVDTSTNATRRWCYMRYCGNRFKARAFRRRSRQPSARRPIAATS